MKQYQNSWRAFTRALKQRNSALRAQQIDVLDGLDSVLAEQGARLHEMRQRHADDMAMRIEKTLKSLKTRLQGIELNYLAGWRGKRYEEALASRRARDLEQGATGAGPHRADLAITSEGVPARTVLSRGEQKAVAAALLITQAELMTATGAQPLLLLDDLHSEFDREHFDAVLERVLEIGGQVWVTGTMKPALPEPGKVFHVEQGRVEELV